MREQILIVEDDKDECNWFKKKLEEKFKTCTIFACNGKKEAIEILETNNINVVITDMRMPETRNGYNLLRFIKTKSPRTQVIVFTAWAELEDGLDCMRAGCFDYIEKENFEKLFSTTSIALEASKSQKDMDSLNERLIIAEWKELKEAKSGEDKGNVLENLCYLIFRSIPGWEKIHRNVRSSTEEFDLVIINESKDETWKRYGTIIFVECKNWTKDKPGKNEFGLFLNKIRGRNPRDCNLGFFISVNGFAETFKTELFKLYQEDIRIIPLTIVGLEKLILSEDRNGLLKKLLYEHILL